MVHSHTTVIITGGSSGIGHSIASKFSPLGYKVINISRNKSGIAGVIDLEADLGKSNLGDIENLLQPHLEYGKFIIIHNAFPYYKDTADRPDLDQIEGAFNCAIKAPMILNKIIIPLMQNGSSIVYIGSTLSMKAIGGSFSYITLKHAIIGMLRATVQDTFGKGIMSFCLCPGFTDTPMLTAHLNEVSLKTVTSNVSYNRLIQPDELATLILKIIDTEVINGAIINADLGQYEN